MNPSSRFGRSLTFIAGILIAIPATAADLPAPASPVVPTADGYVPIPNVAVVPQRQQVYQAIWDVTRGVDKPGQILLGLNMAGSELNAFAVSGVPAANVKFVVVFHGDAIPGILDDAHYRAKFGTSNPNLKVLADFKKAGVEMYVCGQQLLGDKVDPKTLSPDVTVASDALIVLMTYQNKGYALLSF